MCNGHVLYCYIQNVPRFCAAVVKIVDEAFTQHSHGLVTFTSVKGLIDRKISHNSDREELFAIRDESFFPSDQSASSHASLEQGTSLAPVSQMMTGTPCLRSDSVLTP